MQNFDIKTFLETAFEGEEGHLSFDDLMAYLYYEEDQPTLERQVYQQIHAHLEGCDDCRSISESITRHDPFLSVGEKPPEGFWERMWDEVDKLSPPDPNLEQVWEKIYDRAVAAIAGCKPDLLEGLQTVARCAAEGMDEKSLDDLLGNTYDRVISECLNATAYVLSSDRGEVLYFTKAYISERTQPDMKKYEQGITLFWEEVFKSAPEIQKQGKLIATFEGLI